MIIHVSDLCRDSKLREVFRRAEDRGGDPLLPVEPERPKPVLEGAEALDFIEGNTEAEAETV